MIDIEKFICSLLNRASGLSVIKVIDIFNALNNQGLDYKDGKIVQVALELKESEDEKIKKEIISFLKEGEPYHCPNSARRQEWAAWLEKQGEHTNFLNKIQIGDKVTRNKDGMLVNLSQLDRIAKKDEKQSVQKSADKVEPKFKVGDWVVYKCDICQIVKREEGCNKLVTNFGIVKELVNERNLSTARLWTIQDAKDGDVLTDKQNCTCIFREIMTDEEEETSVDVYCGINIDNKFVANEKGEIWTVPEDLFPATKKQRDTLFAKMKEAGYTWDIEKKELKKIEQKSQRIVSAEAKEAMYDKPAWSEEDKAMFGIISDLLWEGYKMSGGKPTWEEIRDWFRSNYPHKHWKPSKEQIKQLEWIAKQNKDNMIGKELMTLYNDLKKLKG